MPPATKPLSPRRMVCPSAAPSLRLEHENVDDNISARLKTLLTERRLRPGGGAQAHRTAQVRSRAPGEITGNARLLAAMRLHIRRSAERLQKEAEAEEAQAEWSFLRGIAKEVEDPRRGWGESGTAPERHRLFLGI